MVKRQGFTTVVDIEDYKKITWSFLLNIKMVWQYEGIAYLFREADIPLYGVDRGTTKMNHPIMAAALPAHKDKNYGVDIFVPVEHKDRALKLVSDMDHVRKCSEREKLVGKDHYAAFESAALEAKQRNRQLQSQKRRKALSRFIPFSTTCKQE